MKPWSRQNKSIVFYLPALAVLSSLGLFGCLGVETNPTPPPGNPASNVSSTTGGPGTSPAAAGRMSAPQGNIPAPSGPIAKGSDFNKLFPKDGDGYNVVYTQEKKGFAQAEVQKSGKKVATLSISDVAANPSAISKYNSSGQQLAGYPAASVGSQGSTILVGNKFQVQVRSTDSSFSASDREAWLQKFDLNGLANMAK